MVGLESSRWASSSTSSTTRPVIQPSRPRSISRADELERHRRLLRRLWWKLPYLADSHRRATVPGADASDADKREAELMFKLDFFEYYGLLERALLHLLAVFGITISKNGGANGASALYFNAHRFHANVLLSLDSPSNPLHPILGVGEVRRHLFAAKDLRNRWKDAEEHALLSIDPTVVETASPPPLSAYEIEQMLGSIFTAFEKAQELADKAVQGTPTDSRMEVDAEDNFSDPMDWEELS